MARAELAAPRWREAIAAAAERLAAAGIESPQADARELAECALAGMPAPMPATVGEDGGAGTGAACEAEPFASFASLVERRAAREPLQHITGTMHFRFLELASRPGVFVARPETEWMADLPIAEANRLVAEGEAPVVLDLCTGSGALALAVATEAPGSKVWGVELSEAAYAVACENNARYGEPATFVKGDALHALSELEGKAAIVVSNPPYVPAVDPISAEAEADPALALWGGGADGLEFPRALVERAASLLRPGGLLVMEHAPSQAQELREAALACGFADARTGRDAAGRERWLAARRKGSPQGGAHGEGAGTQAAGAKDGRPDSQPVKPRSDSRIVAAAAAHEYPAAIAAACEAIRAGELVVLPTDTVYGVGADAFSREAVSRLLTAKGRGRDKPSPVLVASVEAAERLAHVDARARALMKAFWPGALTLVLPARDAVGWDLGETNGTVALRMPDHPLALALLEAAGPLAVSSANLTNEPAATSAGQAREMLGEKVSCYLDAGEAPGGVPSTIVVLGGEAQIVRRGAVGDTEVLDVLSALG